MAIMFDHLQKEVVSTDFADIRSRLDLLLVNELDRATWPKVLKENNEAGHIIRLEFRSLHGKREVARSFSFSRLTDEELSELSRMIDAFETLRLSREIKARRGNRTLN